MKPLIIIFTDSLGAPILDQNEKDNVEYKNVYGYKLKESLIDQYEVELIYINSMDSEDAAWYSKKIVAFRRPDIVIMQFGINDCAPRIFKKGRNPFIYNKNFIALTNNFFGKIIHKYRRQIIKYISRNKVYTSELDFRNNLKKILSDIQSYSSNCKCYILPIASPSMRINDRSPGFHNNVIKYNKILKNIFLSNYLDFFFDIYSESNSDEYLISDGIHLTNEAHEKLFLYIKRKLF